MDVDPAPTPGDDAAPSRPAEPLSLSVFATVRLGQAQHGLRQADYKRYMCVKQRESGGKRERGNGPGGRETGGHGDWARSPPPPTPRRAVCAPAAGVGTAPRVQCDRYVLE